MKQKNKPVNGISVPEIVYITEGYLAGIHAPVLSVTPINMVINLNGLGVDAPGVCVLVIAEGSEQPTRQCYHVAQYKGKLVSQHLATSDERFPLEVCKGQSITTHK